MFVQLPCVQFHASTSERMLKTQRHIALIEDTKILHTGIAMDSEALAAAVALSM